MSRMHRVAAALVLSGAVLPFADAQAPPGTPLQRPGVRPQAAQSTAPAQPRIRRRSIVHHYPYPYPEFYHGDQTAGFRNPGGTGRYLEYYPPGDQFQNANGRDPV